METISLLPFFSLFPFIIIALMGSVVVSFFCKKQIASFWVTIVALASCIIAISLLTPFADIFRYILISIPSFFTLITKDIPIPMSFIEIFKYGLASTSLLLIFIVTISAILLVRYSVDSSRKNIIYALILILTAGMMGVVGVNDIFAVYIFLEVTAVASFTLIALDNNEKSSEGAIKYFYLSAFASVIIIFGISLLLLQTVDTNIYQIICTLKASTNPIPIAISLGIVILGFMIKSGLVPFHMWTLDSYQSAPNFVSVLLAGVVTKIVGVYILIKIGILIAFFMECGHAITNTTMIYNTIMYPLMLFGIVSILIGSIGALYQDNFKRLLAYSSISQMGYIVLAIGVGTPIALFGAVFHMFNHGCFKALLFINADSLEKYTGTCEISKIGNLQHKLPITSLSTNIAMLSTAGIPPLSGFWSKAIIILALWTSGFHLFAVIALFASVITLAYFIRVIKQLFFAKFSKIKIKLDENSSIHSILSLVFVIIIVGVGILFPLTNTILLYLSGV